MARTRHDSVCATGANAGAILMGIYNLNKGLLIKVHEEQEK